MIESLEQRRLLAVSLTGSGTLNITGTSGDDTVILKIKTETDIQPNGDILMLPHLIVRLNNKQVLDRPANKIKKIVCNLFEGDDSFTGVATRGTKNIVNGGPGNDTLAGGSGNDSLDGGDGDDSLSGLDGDDALGSAAGSDTLVGGIGIDAADFHSRKTALNISLDDVANDGETGQTGNVAHDIEIIVCGAGSDLVDASFIHADPLTFTTQAETLVGNGGKDTLTGGDGNDSLVGGNQNDSLNGGPGNDTLVGGLGRDRLNGQDGTDLLIGDFDFNERDTLNGGTGLDTGIYDFMDRVSHL